MSTHGPWGEWKQHEQGYWLDVRGLVACDHIDAVFLAHNAPGSRILRDPAIEDVYDAYGASLVLVQEESGKTRNEGTRSVGGGQ